MCVCVCGHVLTNINTAAGLIAFQTYSFIILGHLYVYVKDIKLTFLKIYLCSNHFRNLMLGLECKNWNEILKYLFCLDRTDFFFIPFPCHVIDHGSLVDWFNSRIFSANGDTSKHKKVQYGVPQGSVLGQQLFFIYILNTKLALIFFSTWWYAIIHNNSVRFSSTTTQEIKDCVTKK